MHVLLVDDEPDLARLVAFNLKAAGFAVTTTATAEEGFVVAKRERPSLAVVDVMLPAESGIDLLRRIRADGDLGEVPVLLLTACGDEADRVRGFESGADDYVVKPFGTDQVAARVRAVLRRGGRATSAAAPVLRVGGLTIDERARVATLDGRPLELTRKEFDLLLALASRPGEVVSKRDLLAEVWQQAYGGSDRTVDVHLSWLRRKLGESAAEPHYLHSVRGVGVRLVDPDDN